MQLILKLVIFASSAGLTALGILSLWKGDPYGLLLFGPAYIVMRGMWRSKWTIT